MHSTSGDVQALRRNLRNDRNHVFGDHRKCNKQFCKTKQSENPKDDEKLNVKVTDSNAKVNATSDPETRDKAMPENIGVEIFDLLKELEEEREEENLADTIEEEALAGGDEYVLDKLPECLFSQIIRCGDRIVSLASQLMQNCTSNAAENFMAVNAKFEEESKQTVCNEVLTN